MTHLSSPMVGRRTEHLPLSSGVRCLGSNPALPLKSYVTLDKLPTALSLGVLTFKIGVEEVREERTKTSLGLRIKLAHSYEVLRAVPNSWNDSNYQ